MREDGRELGSTALSRSDHCLLQVQEHLVFPMKMRLSISSKIFSKSVKIMHLNWVQVYVDLT